MDSDSKTALVFGALTGLIGFVLIKVKESYEELKEKHRIIKEMEAVQTPKSLAKMNEYKGHPFTMVSGVCVSDIGSAKQLQKNKKLYKIDYEVALSSDRNKSHLKSSNKVGKFYLVDP